LVNKTYVLLYLILTQFHPVLLDHKSLWTKNWVSKLQAKKQLKEYAIFLRHSISLELWLRCKFVAKNKNLMKVWHKVLLESAIKMIKAMKLLFQMMMICMQLMIGLITLVKEILNWMLLLMLNLLRINTLKNNQKWSLKEKS